MKCNKLLENVTSEYEKQKTILEDLLSGKIDGKEANKMLFESLDNIDAHINNYKN